MLQKLGLRNFDILLIILLILNILWNLSNYYNNCKYTENLSNSLGKNYINDIALGDLEVDTLTVNEINFRYTGDKPGIKSMMKLRNNDTNPDTNVNQSQLVVRTVAADGSVPAADKDNYIVLAPNGNTNGIAWVGESFALFNYKTSAQPNWISTLGIKNPNTMNYNATKAPTN
jgi:hypothetical protein